MQVRQVFGFTARSAALCIRASGSGSRLRLLHPSGTDAAVVRAPQLVIALHICAALGIFLRLPLPLRRRGGGILTAVLRHAALLVGASLPLVCISVHLLVPHGAVTVAIIIGVASEVAAIDGFAALDHSAPLELVQAVLTLPHCA